MTGATRERVFISYSHRDRAVLERLQVHLAPFVRDGRIDPWDDTRIQPGARWEGEIQHALATARVAVLLVSADFLASSFVSETELPVLLARAENDGVVILPVIVGPSSYEHTAIAAFQAVNPPERPLLGMSEVDQERVLVELAEAVVAALTRSVPARGGAVAGAAVPWNVPPRNFTFSGREDVLRIVEEQLDGTGRVMVSGLGGVGKTQLAIEVARRVRDRYSAVLWVSADTPESLRSGYEALASVLELASAGDDREQAGAAVTEWLAENDGWLLIIDGADDPTALESVLVDRQGRPGAPGAGHVLVTSRAPTAPRLGFVTSISLDQFAPDEALEFAAARLGRDLDEGELAAAAELTRLLGGLPLALEQALAHISNLQLRIADYLEIYRARRLELLGESAPELGGDREPVATTWSISFHAVEATSPESAALLRLSAFLAVAAVPLELLTRGFGALESDGPVAMQEAVADEVRLGGLLSPLHRQSLIRRDVAQRTFSVHPLVQEVVRASMDRDEQRRWAGRAVATIAAAMPRDIYAEWRDAELLLPHAVQAGNLVAEHELAGEAGIALLDRTGMLLFELYDFDAAGRLYEQALDAARREYGDRDSHYSDQLINVARVAIARGDDDRARHHLEQAERIDREVIGTDRPDYAVTITTIGQLEQRMGDLSSAEQRMTRALEIMRDTFGDWHTQVAAAWHNLANVSDLGGDPVSAAQQYLTALQIYEQLVEPDDPRIATSAHFLGTVLSDNGAASDALPYLERAYEIRRDAMAGSIDHLATLGALALAHERAGNLDDAAQRWQELIGFDRDAGEGLVLAAHVYQLAQVRLRQRRFAESEALFGEALAIETGILGGDHPDVALTLRGMAWLYEEMGDYETSRQYYERTRAVQVAALGPGDDEVAATERFLQDMLRKASATE
jgi:tetratricopeptide (TPR) repeat protein